MAHMLDKLRIIYIALNWVELNQNLLCFVQKFQNIFVLN